MTNQEISKALKDIIEPYVENPELLKDLKEDVNLMEQLRVDSVDLVEIVLDIEEKFEIQIEDHLIQTLQTPQDIVELIQNKLD